LSSVTVAAEAETDVTSKIAAVSQDRFIVHPSFEGEPSPCPEP
jgi:hypothetical protein